MSGEALSRAEALFARKEKKRTEGVVAMADYFRKQEHQLANLARLRTLRLDREQSGNRRRGSPPSRT